MSQHDLKIARRYSRSSTDVEGLARDALFVRTPTHFALEALSDSSRVTLVVEPR